MLLSKNLTALNPRPNTLSWKISLGKKWIIFLETFSLFPNENFPQQKEEVEAEVQTNFSNDIPVVN